MQVLIRCALGYDMGPGARPVIHPVTEPRNRASEYLVGDGNSVRGMGDGD